MREVISRCNQVQSGAICHLPEERLPVAESWRDGPELKVELAPRLQWQRAGRVEWTNHVRRLGLHRHVAMGRIWQRDLVGTQLVLGDADRQNVKPELVGDGGVGQ